ncbi:cation transporter [Salinisphaera orenii]|uniref:Cation diffusion facilitator family transporter n=1 Tax=Salinisphaera orenii YIM 95161 TaxID=1051139 RepID=A0A423PSK9_9GAMM|nr:cation transporter [Salinisphaera halophila]ROO28558.1 cation diffusion facilitator family transporter [Salinisphaera halophila YIM 95161]
MACCCNENDADIAALRRNQARVLWAVLALNAVMFVGEFTAGWLAQSTALLADSLDMLGDSLVYALSLFVIDRGGRAKAGAAGFKGSIMLAFGLIVAADVLYKAFHGAAPVSAIMAVAGTLALIGNVVCLILLTRHRGDDVNMGSAWICSRNDLIANSGVILAAGLVALTHSVWPDIIIGGVIAAVFLRSSIGVLADALAHWRQAGDTRDVGRAPGSG